MAGTVWSDVPWDIIYLLAERMTADLSDLVRLGAVCSSWRSLLLENQWLGYTQQLEALVGVSSLHLPKLMFPEVDEYCFPDTPMNFFDMGTPGRIFQLHLPEASGRNCCGSGSGWLVTTNDDMEVYLLNPITREQIRLPSQSSFGGLQLGIAGKAVVVGDPCKPGDCTVAAVFPTRTLLVITKPGRDSTWKMAATHHKLNNIVHHRGLLYGFSNWLSHLEVWNMNPTLQRVKIASLASPFPPHADFRLCESYLVQVSGRFLGVATFFRDDISELGRGTLIVVELVDGRRWVEVNDLGDCCLLLGERASVGLSPVPPGSGFRPNCLYISQCLRVEAIRKHMYNIMAYNLDDKSFQPLLFGDLVSFLWVPATWATFNPTCMHQ